MLARTILLALLAILSLAAAQHQGRVLFRDTPVPGAAVTASHGDVRQTATTGEDGVYYFADLPDGAWNIEVNLVGFEAAKQTVSVSAGDPPVTWSLTMLPLDRILSGVRPAQPATAVQPAAQPKQEKPAQQQPPAQPQPSDDDLRERAADGLLISGSVNNTATSAFAQPFAFGNNRHAGNGLYNGGVGLIGGLSAFDARPYSLSGQNTPRPTYGRITGTVNFGGPLRIPNLLRNGPFVFLGYQWTRSSNARTASALVPDASERDGIFSRPITDPGTGLPFASNTIPQARISPQARTLLSLYPQPNFTGDPRYNYQVPLLNITHQDALQTRVNKILGLSNQVFAQFSLQSTRADSPNLFGFLDTARTTGIDTTANWSHRVGRRIFINTGIQFSRLIARTTPYFPNRTDIATLAGISGVDRQPANWGPPSLTFAGGIAALSDAQSSLDRNQTSGVSGSLLWNRGSHNLTFGGGVRRQQLNALSQQDPRGSFTFNGASTGSDLGDLLLGIPTAASIAYGNADKYFRNTVYDAFAMDDWRIKPGLTLNAGLRWDYASPITEQYGRLVNLDIGPAFTTASPVVARSLSSPLIQPDKRGFSPRVAIAWRPLTGSSLLIRAGYGVYYDTSVYQAIASRMSQQPPVSRTLSLQNTSATPLTLADAFLTPAPSTANTFAVDPAFRVGYSQNWQLSLQRDLPAALQLTGTYLGIKGTHAMQAILPNTFPAGSGGICDTCPAGFVYVTSGGNSTRHAAQIQLRRRLRSGFAATLQYTFSKSIDDAAALGSPSANNQGAPPTPTGLNGIAIAQNWRDLHAERSLSSFDQRHAVSLIAQYTSGIGLGRNASILKGWTVASQLTAGTGMPQTPIYLAPVQGTGITGSLRPDYIGGTFVAPNPGSWGNAGRNTITGPSQFNMSASLARTFQATDRLNLDVRVDAANALNAVTFTSWNTVINSAQFLLPAAAGPMRTLQLTLRLRF